jgi:hypothetical protein
MRVVLTDAAAPVGQQPQHLEGLVVDDLPQPGHPDPDEGDRVRVGVIRLAALSGRVDPHPRRQLRWHVNDSLAMVEQAKGHLERLSPGSE